MSVLCLVRTAPTAGEAVRWSWKEAVVLPEYALKLSEPELARYRFMADSAARMERDLWALSGIEEGAVVADLGCGPAAVSVVVAGIVGPGGRVVAVDRDARTSKLLAQLSRGPARRTSRLR